MRPPASQDKKRLSKLFRIYRELDKQTESFQKASGLKCKAGCGHCCENPDVETTAFEMMPAAMDLWQKNLGEIWLDKIEKFASPGRCVFYEPHPSACGQGRCTIYPLRPLICRLFGFSAKKNKTGDPVLVTCGIIKKEQPQEYARTVQRIAKGLKIPVMPDYTAQVTALDPGINTKPLPINMALKTALELIGFKIRLRGQDRQGSKA